MRKETVHEVAVMLVLIAASAVVFLETAALTQAPPGQIAPATFPRLAAGALGAMAAFRLGQVALGFVPVGVDVDWSWRAAGKPLLATLLMIGYYLAFGQVPFALLTFGFVGLAFWTFGVRPLIRLLLGTAIATGFFYVLFTFLLRIPV